LIALKIRQSAAQPLSVSGGQGHSELCLASQGSYASVLAFLLIKIGPESRKKVFMMR
jgi:hypothetical protein